MHAIVEKLVTLIDAKGWRCAFEAAIRNAQTHRVRSVRHVRTLDDYLRLLDDLLTWAPREQGDTRLFHQRLVEVYFFLDQEPLKSLQSPIRPGRPRQRLSPLSQWIVEYTRALGAYLATPESAKHVESFRKSPLFNWDEYMPPPGGYLTFNQFFARHVKPGMRPVADPANPALLVAPADSSFVGWWQISEGSKIHVGDDPLSIKGIQWSIRQLLEGSAYAGRFRGGIFTHSFLNTFDYHRLHAPVPGKVVEARVVQGQAYLDVTTRPAVVDGERASALVVVDGTGYQFVQTRGIVILDSPVGLVACLPIGMGQISSVVITAEEGVTLRKGEELGYFQAGASDFVMVFERSSNVRLISRPGEHVQQGAWIGTAFPQ